MTQLDQLTLDLFDVRARLISTDDAEAHSAHTSAVETLKRKRSSSGSASEAHAASLRAFLQLHRTTRARAIGVLDAWSVGSHSSSSSSSAPGGGKAAAQALRAVNTGAGAQVRAALEGEGVERLVKRARVWRGDKKLGLEDLDEEESEKREDAQTFDDSDFYATLLRELLESKGDVGSAGESSSLLPALPPPFPHIN